MTKRFFHALWRHPGHLIWVLVAYFPLLDRLLIPLTGDQRVYLSVANEMRERGSWLIPYLFGEPSYLKPPLQYWATLVGWKVFGFGLTGAFLPSALAVVLSAWLVGEIVKLLSEKAAFVNAGLLFAACLGTATFGLAAQMEIHLCLWMLAAWWSALKYLARPMGERKRIWLYLAFFCAGTLGLVKSPLYFGFWVVGFFTYLTLRGEWDIVLTRHFYFAAGVGLAATSWWYLAVAARDGAHLWNQHFISESLEKWGGNASSMSVVWLGLVRHLFPFSLLALAAIPALWRGRRSSRILAFVFSWCWPAALFFSFYPYRTSTYLYVLVPAFAVMIDWGYYSRGRTRSFNIALWMTGGLTFLVLMGVAVVLRRMELAPVVVYTGFAVSGAFALLCAANGWMRGLVLAALGSVLALHWGATELGERDIRPMRSIVSQFPLRSVAILDLDRNVWNETGMLSVAIGRSVTRIFDLDEAVRSLQTGSWLLLSDQDRNNHFRTIEAKLLGRGDSRDFDEFPWRRLGTRVKLPLTDLLKASFSFRSPESEERLEDLRKSIEREFSVVRLK